MTKTVTSNNVKITEQPRCETCGRVLSSHIQVGDVRLPPFKARIFQLVQGRPGISNADISGEIYGTVDNRTMGLVRVHVNQLRDMLLGTGVTVRGNQHYGYTIQDEPA